MSDSESAKCTICLEGMCTKSRRVVLNCNHEFHDDCAAEMVQSMTKANCPLCRADFGIKKLLNERDEELDIATSRWPALLRAHKERQSQEDAHRAFMEGVLRNAFDQLHTLSVQRNMLNMFPFFLGRPIAIPAIALATPYSRIVYEPQLPPTLEHEDTLLMSLLEAASSSPSVSRASRVRPPVNPSISEASPAKSDVSLDEVPDLSPSSPYHTNSAPTTPRRNRNLSPPQRRTAKRSAAIRETSGKPVAKRDRQPDPSTFSPIVTRASAARRRSRHSPSTNTKQRS